MTARRTVARHHAFDVTASTDEVRRRIGALPRGRFRLVESREAGAVLSRRVSWATWGDRFELAWRDQGTGTAVDVTAVKRFPTALGDYGQGVRDVRRLIRLLAQ